VIAEYLDETRGLGLGDRRLLPEDPAGRAEARRLMAWFNVKFFNEASCWIVREKVYKRFMPTEQGGGSPDMELVRAARTNIRYHLRYIGYLTAERNWLAGVPGPSFGSPWSFRPCGTVTLAAIALI